MFPVLNAGWLQIGVSAFTMHEQALPPVPVPAPNPPIPGLIEGPAFMGWPPGMLSHKTAPTVKVDGNPGVQQGHDIGYVIPHFAIPMNALCALNTLLSKHKVMFPISSVKLEKKPVGTYLLFLAGLICCNPMSLPSGVLIILKCTVWTKMTLADFFKGLAMIAIDMLFDRIWNKVKGRLPRLPGAQKGVEVLGDLTLREMVLWGGAGLVGRYVVREGANKVFQHIVKSWVLGPLVTGLPWGKVGVGRGNRAGHSWKIF